MTPTLGRKIYVVLDLTKYSKWNVFKLQKDAKAYARAQGLEGHWVYVSSWFIGSKCKDIWRCEPKGEDWE